jgi:iron complex transport system substrate-binding protein
MSRHSAPIETLPSGWTEPEFRELLAALTRRRLITGAAAAGMMAALGARGVSAQQSTPTSGTRLFDTAMGPVEIPVQPTRIVCIGSYAPEDLIDAGVTPVGITEIDLEGFASVYKDGLAGVPTVGTFAEPDLEKIIALHPDLILAISVPWLVESYEDLSSIAPTVLVDYTVPNAWLVMADIFADAAGAVEGLEQLKGIYNARVEEVKTACAVQLGTFRWGIANGWGSQDNQFTLYYPDSAPGKVLSDLGAIWITAAMGKTGTNELFSYESLNLLADADIILTYGDRDGVINEVGQIMADQPLFKQLKATQNDHVYAITNIIPASYGDAISLLDKLEVILKTFA